MRGQTRAHETEEYRYDCVDCRPFADVNKIDYDTTGYDEISNGMKSMLTKVELMKKVIEEITPMLLISGWMTLPNIADIPGNETELSVMSVDRYRTDQFCLFCTNRFTTFDCRNSFEFRMLCNIVRVNGYHVSIPRVESVSDEDDLHHGSWQVQTAHQSPKEDELKDYIFALDLKYTFIPDNEEYGKISDEGTNKNPTEYFNMTVHVRTINGKTIILKCDRQQEAAKILETVARKTLISRGVMYLVNQENNRRK